MVPGRSRAGLHHTVHRQRQQRCGGDIAYDKFGPWLSMINSNGIVTAMPTGRQPPAPQRAGHAADRLRVQQRSSVQRP